MTTEKFPSSLPDLPPLSDFWRVKKSDNPAEEYALILRAAEDFVSLLGKEYAIRWNIELGTKKKLIVLDFSPLVGRSAPIDGEIVDVVIGQAIHEAGHFKFSPPLGMAWNFFWERMSNPEDIEKAYDIFNLLEDLYVENKLAKDFPILSLYFASTRRFYMSRLFKSQEVLKRLKDGNPTFSDILTAWAKYIFFREDFELHPKIAEKIVKLLDIAIETIKTDQPRKRFELAMKAWEILKEFSGREEPAKPLASEADEQKDEKEEGFGAGREGEREKESEAEEKDEDKKGGEKTEEDENKETEAEKEGGEEEKEEKSEKKGEGSEKREEESKGKEEDEKGGGKKPEGFLILERIKKMEMPRELVAEVEKHITAAKESEDITNEVREITGSSGGEKILISVAGINESKAAEILKKAATLAPEIKAIFEWDKRERTRYRRGLLEGTVDKRRLARAGTGNYRIFKRKEILSAPNLGVAVLVDASGSMDGYPLTKALEIAFALKLGIEGENVKLVILGYKGFPTSTEIYRIYDRSVGIRAGIYGNGGTPSGNAIAGVAVNLPKLIPGVKDYLIIHITDGEPDDYEKVEKAVDACLKRGIEVLTITTSPYRRDLLDKAYKGLYEYIRSLEELPKVLKSLLVKRLKTRMLKPS